MTHPNITAYDGVEELASFDNLAFEQYCQNKIDGCGKQVSFVRKFVNENTCVENAVEIGSGNGKLLYALERDGLIRSGVGYELSSSRVNFANKFSDYIGSKNVENICGDFLEIAHKENTIDLVFAVDIVMQLIAPVSNNAEKILLDKVFGILKPGGRLILELMDFSSVIRMHELCDGDLNLWKEFESHDPWQYGLDKFSINGDDVIWDKRFINRDRNIDDSVFQNILRQYTFHSIQDKLCQAGFSRMKVVQHKYWRSEGDIPKDEFIVSAEK